jgi:Fe(3+) dicitrate transport protein
LPFTVVYTYTDATFQSDFVSDFSPWGTVNKGDKIPYIANNQFTALVSFEHKLFSVSISGRYLDAMRTRAGQGPIAASEKTDDQFIIDASANYNLQNNLSLFANLTNLTDAVYLSSRNPAGLRPGMPRAFMAGVRLHF